MAKLPRPNGAALAVLVALAVTGASAGAAAISQLGEEARRDTTTKVVDLRPADVRRVSVTSAGRTVTVERGSDARWSAGPDTPEESATLMFTFEQRLFPMSAFRTLPEAEDEFGLDDPELTLTVTDDDGDGHELAFGAETFTGGAHYVRRAGAPPVYLVPVRMMNDLRSLLAGKQIDRENSLPGKIRDLDRAAEERADAAETGFWLRQSLDAGTPVPEGLE